jgi:hypothetical protein
VIRRAHGAVAGSAGVAGGVCVGVITTGLGGWITMRPLRAPTISSFSSLPMVCRAARFATVTIFASTVDAPDEFFFGVRPTSARASGALL